VRKQKEDFGYSWGENRKKWLLDFEGGVFNLKTSLTQQYA
jgi:hypothetical protein